MRNLLEASEWLLAEIKQCDHDCKSSADSGCYTCFQMWKAEGIIREERKAFDRVNFKRGRHEKEIDRQKNSMAGNTD